jgi:hypothetical protein
VGLLALPHISRAGQIPLLQSKNADSKKGQKSGRILLLIDEPVSGASVGAGSMSRALSQKLAGADLSVTSISELNEKDATRVRRAIEKLLQGDRKAGSSIPFAVIIMGKISATAVDPFSELYVAEANGIIKSIDVSNGKTIALENISAVRGFGNAQEQASKNALKTATEKISEQFIKQTSAAAR